MILVTGGTGFIGRNLIRALVDSGAEYYGILERTQKGTLDVTPWMAWFLGCLGRAIDGAEIALAEVLVKARFWQAFGTVPMISSVAGFSTPMRLADNGATHAPLM